VRAVDATQVAQMFPQGELYVFVPVVTLLRFGKWDEVLAEPSPAANLTLDRAVFLYARGVAFANKGQIDQAEAARKELEALVAVGDFSRYEQFAMPGKPLATLALDLLEGEVARARGDLDGAIRHFREAAATEAGLPYTEPPWWHQPVSHVLGAALLEARRPAEAEAVYRESLKTYRDDGWALFGLAQALDVQGKTADAAEARRQFERAWQFADVRLTSSRQPS
jgi:tetratricopeptide (TPR) repeat protein